MERARKNLDLSSLRVDFLDVEVERLMPLSITQSNQAILKKRLNNFVLSSLTRKLLIMVGLPSPKYPSPIVLQDA